MDYKKKYNEALERAKECHVDGLALHQPVKDVLEYIFPELKESEDERMMHQLHSWMKEFGGAEEYTEKVYTWLKSLLEKQGGKKETLCDKCRKEQPSHSCQDITALGRCYIEGMNSFNNLEPKFKVGDIIIKSQNSDINKFGKFKITGIKDGRYWYNEFVICEISEQDEWELVPKFNVGDWVVCGKLVTQITSIENDGYTNSDQGFISFETAKKFHLWTIQDAKDGDVLINWNNTAFIFKTIEDETVKFHVAYNEKWEAIKTPSTILSHMGLPEPQFEFHPATKEQHDTLMKAMADAGWEFDFEKKELKKIEKNIDVGHEYFSDLLEKDDCDNIDDYAYQCAYCMSHDWMKDTATWDDVERACKLGAEWNERHHNSSWSEEDAVNFNLVYTYVSDDSLRDWLKELKDRVQPQTTWKPNDEQMEALDNFIFAKYPNIEKYEKSVKLLYNDLKKLTEE